MATDLTQQLYQQIREWLTANNIPIAHSVENFNALINTFYGREQNGVFAFDLMKKHFDVYTLEDGSIDPQAAADINTYLEGVGAGEHAKFDSSFSTDSGPVTGGVGSATPTVGGPAQADGTPPGIMPGGTLTKINRDGADPLWAITYTVNGIQHVYTFDSYETVLATLGPDPATNYGMMTLNWDSVNDGDTWLLGDAAAFFGQTGQSYAMFFDNAMQEAALEAGVRNPGLLGEYLSQPEIQRIMAMGAAGGWSPERTQAEIRLTGYYQNTLYPGINTFLQQGVGNPEAAYWNYMDNVSGSLAALGYEKDRFGTYRDAVGEMLTAGITAESFTKFAPDFIRAEQSGEFAATLNRWTELDLGVSLDFDNWFDVLAGNADPAIAQVVEKATIQFQAERSNTILSSDQITRLADLTQLSEQMMTVAFTDAEKALLSVGQADLDRYGLSQEALVNAAFSIETGGMSSADVQRQARKAATELSIQDDEKAGFFLGFDRFARPNRQGLLASAPEAG